MVKSSAQRLGKYGKKIRAAVLPGQGKHYKTGLSDRLRLERLVKSLPISPMMQFNYIAFGERILKASRKYTGRTLENEACIEWTRWLSRCSTSRPMWMLSAPLRQRS